MHPFEQQKMDRCKEEIRHRLTSASVRGQHEEFWVICHSYR